MLGTIPNISTDALEELFASGNGDAEGLGNFHKDLLDAPTLAKDPAVKEAATKNLNGGYEPRVEVGASLAGRRILSRCAEMYS